MKEISPLSFFKLSTVNNQPEICLIALLWFPQDLLGLEA